MDLLKKLTERVLVGDGAMGTELMRLGAPAGKPLELLNLSWPDLPAQVHRAYLEAGSDLVLTNTFGGTSIKLAHFNEADQTREVNLAGARIAREAAGDKAFVGGDMGPCGELLKPYGPAEPDDVREAFRVQALALAEGGADFLSLETFFDLAEALLALEAALETGLPVSASMTFDVKERGIFTMMGNRAAECAQMLAAGGATLVGANCTVTAEKMPPIAAALREGTDLPMIFQPNAGQPETVGGVVHYRETPEHFASYASALVKAGARIIGGCCGTGPVFVRALSDCLSPPPM
jgi:5-methyltetrahydrofolate--homocysteine methyltransferase